MSMAYKDNDTVLRNWNDQYGVKYPGCSKDGGAEQVKIYFEIPGVPWFVIIAPNKTVFYKGNKADGLGNKLLEAGIKKHTCDSPNVDINYGHFTSIRPFLSINTVTSTSINFMVPIDGIYTLSVYSLRGRLIEKIFIERNYPKGDHTINGDFNNRANNIFLLELKSNTNKVTKKIVF